MNEIENEKAIINESPDFETQREIINEEKIAQKKLRKFYVHIGCIFCLMIIIVVTAYVTLDLYKEYNFFSNDVCLNVNINTEGTDFKNINVTGSENCAPEYNIDYYNNRKATFNIDLFGDKSKIFNPTNQKDENGYCKLNCDSNGDNWPDYNIDLNGDGIADVNIVKDYANSNTCDLNCDLNHDTIPDVNITDALDNTIPLYNIDYKGNRKPEFNIKNEDGSITNAVNRVTPGAVCESNCDIDGDGFPDYNIKLPENDSLLNELVTPGDTSIDYNLGKTVDWKCFISNNLPSCETNSKTANNKYINIDVDGNGTADINVSSDKGANVTNPLNKQGTYNGKNITLNEDADNDGFPDYNIDINNDGTPDLNITEENSHVCVKNCDTNYDGIADYLIDYDKANGNSISIYNANIDVDFDTKCDINCDTNYDLYPDLNIDINGDSIPDINIDVDGDGIPDYNIDTDNDHKADGNLSARLDGTCNFRCTNQVETIVDEADSCTVNCDTNNDGWPDKNVDLNYDGICDINCDDNTNIDNNHDYFIDEEDHTKDMVIDKNNDGTFYVLNPIDIVGQDIEPGWEDIYVLKIVNNTNYAMAYQFAWQDIINEFTEANNLQYEIIKNGGYYLTDMKTPYSDTVLDEEILIRPKASVKYIMKIKWPETGEDQNIDSGKKFQGKLTVTTKK